MKKLILLLLFTFAPLSSLLAGEPCGVQLSKLSQASASPGEEFSMYGLWGKVQGDKLPCINKGKRNDLEVVSWTHRVLKVRVPSDLPYGTYKVGVYCNDPYAGGTYSSGWKTFDVVKPKPIPSTPPEPQERAESPIDTEEKSITYLFFIGLLLLFVIVALIRR